MKIIALVLVLTTLLVPFSPSEAKGADSIVDIAVGSDQFKTLVAAVKAAGLVEALAGPGPFTVFAPTDSAFSRIDNETLQFLLSDRGLPELQNILKHHVVAGRFDASALVGLDQVETLAGTALELSAIRGRVIVDEAAVEAADIVASNGVIHVIDRVLLPPPVERAVNTLLSAAIERGVPLFNDGSPEACCAVYVTALEALVLGTGFDLSDSERKTLRGRLVEAEKMTDARALAWEYRGLIDAVIQGELKVASTPVIEDVSGKSIFTFDSRDQVRRWRTVLDGVMGGQSTGKISHAGSTMVFEGATSLRNNGGFSSMRTSLAKKSLDGFSALQVRVKGDGRTYILGSRGSSGASRDSYWARFDTVAGEWITVTVPIEKMERHFFGQKLPGKIDPSQIGGLDFYIYDKKAGPFRLEIDSIVAVPSLEADIAFGNSPI